MRILVATDQWFPDLRGGSARVAAETARRLARRGHDVVVLAPRAAGKPVETAEGSLVVRRVLRRSALPQTLTDVATTRAAARALRRSAFDLLLAHQPTTAVGLAAAGIDAPSALVFHASPALELRFLRSRLRWGPRRLSTYALEPALVLLERSAVRRTASVLVLSEYSRSLLLGRHADADPRTVLVFGGVDTALFSPGDGVLAARGRLGVTSDLPLLLTVRRLEPRMGLEELLHAVGRLASSRDLVLAVVGDGFLREPLRKLARELGLAERVRFLGRLPEKELRDWYRAADLFVLPTAAYEGFGMVTAEALASGTPVVGTPVGATPELLRPLEPRLVARGADAGSLALAIADALVLAGEGLRRRCCEYARERFDWDRVIGGWEEALVEAAARSPTFASRALDVPAG